MRKLRNYIFPRMNSPRRVTREKPKRAPAPAVLPAPTKANPTPATSITRGAKALPIHQMPNFSVDHLSAPRSDRRLTPNNNSAQQAAAPNASKILIAILLSNIARSAKRYLAMLVTLHAKTTFRRTPLSRFLKA
jgi:hypothetical protein